MDANYNSQANWWFIMIDKEGTFYIPYPYGN